MNPSPIQTTIQAIEEKIKFAYRENRWSEVKSAISELVALDPKNHLAAKLLDKIKKAEEAIAKLELERQKPKQLSLISRFMKFLKTRKALVAKPVLKPIVTAKPNVFQALASKVDQNSNVPPAIERQKIITTPLASLPAKIPTIVTQTPQPVAPIPVATKPLTKLSVDNGGNIFTKLFGKQQTVEPVRPTHSIIDTIVSKTGKEQIPHVLAAERIQNKTGMHFRNFASAFLQFTIFFILITAGFFYAQNLDKENRVMGFFGQENYASRLHRASQELEAQKQEEQEIDREVKRYQQGYNNRYEQIVKNIVDNRINWPDILDKINEITDTIYEHNELSQYIQYSSFSFDAEKGIVRVSGTLTDPLGKNLTKMAELEQAFMTYPHDPKNPDDPTKPYFYDFQEFNSFRKTLDKRTGRYSSNFQLSFSLAPSQTKK